MKPADLLSALKRTVEQLAAFNEIAKVLTSTLETREVLSLVMQKVSAVLKPANWSLLLLDEASGTLYFEIAVGNGAERLRDLRVRPGEGIAGQVFLSGQPRRVDDVRTTPDFSPRFDAASSFRTRSVLAAPLVFRGRVLGVIELVNGEGDPAFTDEDLQAVTAVADFAAIAIENARNFQRAQELTLTDEHTGLGNVRQLRALLEREVTRARGFGHPLALLFLDLDHFKAVNDAHGHLVGSAVLREVGVLLREHARPVDSAFRYGGDEFAVLLPETGPQRALESADRLAHAFRARRFTGEQGLQLRVTASIGVACFPDHARDGIGLIAASDRAMYSVKAQGRDGTAPAAPAAPRLRPAAGGEAVPSGL
ncbi:MAG TPA: sensor domain-containing diguanylate cyclase [Myxococcaceae bacterium]|jgi:diguanylate cyclase (GGDEF)-like protein|nr:sensor domain-containing diguanylate cyclase [Myxococcaceae bacterium]